MLQIFDCLRLKRIGLIITETSLQMQLDVSPPALSVACGVLCTWLSLNLEILHRQAWRLHP